MRKGRVGVGGVIRGVSRDQLREDTGLFQIQMRISFPFLRAKDLCTYLLIMRTRSFLLS